MNLFDPCVRLVRRWRWSLLLALLIAALLLEPLFGTSGIASFASMLIFAFVLGGAVHIGRLPRRATAATIALIAIWLVLQLPAASLNVSDLNGVRALVALAILLAALIATFAELAAKRDSDTDALVGAIFGYFMIATAWAVFYMALEGWRPGAFTLIEGQDAWLQLRYFSLVTMTTLGYGDIVPLTPLGRILAALQASVGTLYIAVLIGRIVGGSVRKR